MWNMAMIAIYDISKDTISVTFLFYQKNLTKWLLLNCNDFVHAVVFLVTLFRDELALVPGQTNGNLLLSYICNFHVLSHLLLICKLHWNLLSSPGQERVWQQIVATVIYSQQRHAACARVSWRLFSSDLHMKFPCLKSFTIDLHM